MSRSFTKLQIVAFAIIIVFQPQAQTGDAIFPADLSSTAGDGIPAMLYKHISARAYAPLPAGIQISHHHMKHLPGYSRITL
jgi:hypothetical protein